MCAIKNATIGQQRREIGRQMKKKDKKRKTCQKT